MTELIGLAIVLFISTNIDDVFVILAFFADPRFSTGQIVIGQYVGIFALLLISIVASLVSLVLSPEHAGLLGLLPVLIGLKKLVDLWLRADTNEEEPKATGVGAVFSVAAVTTANGGDNIGVYTPVFATRSMVDILIIGAVFGFMTAIWLGVGHWLVNHPKLGAPIRRYGHRVVPFVLIGLGLLILNEAGSFAMLTM